MANPIKGEVPLDVGGKHYTFVLGTYALAALERKMGMPWPRIIKRAVDNEWGVNDVLIVAQCALLKHHRNMTEEQVGELIDEVGIGQINTVIGEALKLMQPEAIQGDAAIPENPTRPGNGHGMNSSPIG